MRIRFSEDLEKILIWSRDEAQRTGWYNIGPDHLMLAILRHSDNDACRILSSFGVRPSEFKEFIDDQLFREESIPYGDNDGIRFNDKAGSCLNMAVFESSRQGCGTVTPVHLLIAIAEMTTSLSAIFLNGLGISRETIVLASGKSAGTEKKETCQMTAPSPEIVRALSAELERLLLQGPGNWKSFS